MCPNIDANLYAANFENTKASMAILAKKQDFTSLDIYNWTWRRKGQNRVHNLWSLILRL